MTVFSTTALAAAFSLLGAAHGHMVINTPYPYNLHKSSPLLQVNPLGADFPFPCQGVSTIEETTSIKAGDSQLVKFTGGAQHGGGSCQFSLTYEYPPPKDKSKWKTIYTLIGGCPVSAAGNLPPATPDQDGRANSAQCGNDSGTECIRQFNIPIPNDIPNGNATFAWTWFNKIGNRELYMNCAPVTISGGSSSTAFFDSLPQMFVANIPGECTTNNGVLNIPNPGNFGKVLEQPAPGSEGSCPKAEGIPTFNGASPAAPPAAPPVVGGGSPPASAPVPTTFITRVSTTAVLSDASAPITVVPVVPSPITVVPVVPSPITVVPVPPPSAPSGGASSGSTACSPDGAIVCIGASQFGICDHGFAVAQPLAPGTTCVNGVIA